MLPVVLSAGLLDSINPCAIGVLLLYLALLLGLTDKRGPILTFGFFYILGVYFVYLLIGLGILQAVHFFGIHNFFGYLAALFLILMGILNLTGKMFFFLNRCRIPGWDVRATALSGLFLGGAVAVCEFPCTGGIYLATLGLLAAKATFWRGFLYLLLYNLMFVMPLILIFALAGNKVVSDKVRNFQTKNRRRFEIITGIFMVILGGVVLVWLLI